jgi:type IV pilus assembly protein PilN
MLRINLLPIRQLKKRAKARTQIVGFAMIFCGILAVLGFIGMLQISKIESVETAIADLQKEEKRLAPIIAEVDKLERQKADLLRKIAIIEKLRKESSLTVHVLDEVAQLVDNTRMWLTGFNQKGASLQLKGVALDNRTVALFMETLKESAYITNVNLSSSTLKRTGKGLAARDFKSFGLSCSVGFPQEKKNDVKTSPKQ